MMVSAARTSAVGNQAVLRKMQAKLEISQPGDPAEVEADRMADQVMRMPDSATGPTGIGPAWTGGSETTDRRAYRKCAGCEEKASHVARKDAPDRNAGSTDLGEAAARDVEVGLQSHGEALDADTRAYMEPRFGSDFTGVRVHSGATAAESARAVNALAYTVGEDIVFGAGQYSPGTAQGRGLLSHELAHVVQQQGTSQAPNGGGAIGRRTDMAEADVHRAPAGLEPGSAVGGQDVGSAMPQGPKKGCDCDPAPVCGDTTISGPAFKGFQVAATWLGPAEQKINDYKSAPADPANTKAAKALSDHFSWTGPGPLTPDIPKIILQVIKDVRTGMAKCPFSPDCTGTGGPEHAGSPNAWSQTNCYMFYPLFKKDGPILQAQIALHEAIHSWDGIGAVETYEVDGPPKYPPPAASAQNNPDSFACLIRDLGALM
jgi:hypothetical protein